MSSSMPAPSWAWWGLVRVDSKQVEYVDLEQQNKIEVSEEKSPVASFFGGLAAKIKEYLGL